MKIVAFELFRSLTAATRASECVRYIMCPKHKDTGIATRCWRHFF